MIMKNQNERAVREDMGGGVENLIIRARVSCMLVGALSAAIVGSPEACATLSGGGGV